MEWAVDPAAVVWVTAGELLWLRAARTLRGRGWRVPGWQIAAWHAGVLLTAAGLLSPLPAYADDGLAPHMAEHLLLADLAAPLLLIGLRSPVLVHLLPPSALAPLARMRRLRSVLRALRHPLVALALFALLLYGWHMSVMFEAAVEHELVHVLQHASFVGGGVLVWWCALEPKRRRTPGELWKIGHILAARLVSLLLGMGFIVLRTPVYTDVYGTGERAWGLRPLGDQQVAGGMMMVVDVVLMMTALILFFVRSAQDFDRREEEARRGAATAGATGRPTT